MKPQTFMNNSGEAVAPAAKFYKVPPEHILVVSDEIHLQPGRLRIRTKGSAGGHNGLKSIIACLGTDAFPRIRIGVGAPPHPDYDMPDWVLGTFRGEDKTAMDDAAVRAAEACAVYIRDGADRQGFPTSTGTAAADRGGKHRTRARETGRGAGDP